MGRNSRTSITARVAPSATYYEGLDDVPDQITIDVDGASVRTRVYEGIESVMVLSEKVGTAHLSMTVGEAEYLVEQLAAAIAEARGLEVAA